MQSVKDRIKNNVRLYARLKSIQNLLLSREEREYQKFLQIICEIDSISDFGTFRKAIAPVLQREKLFLSTAYGSESFFYGYYNEIVHYSGRNPGGISLIPMFEHGIRFASPKRDYDKYSLSYACQGGNRVFEIHSVNPWKLVFSFGPYIHYAREYYDQHKFEALKKQLGRVLLVFPSHTWEEDILEGSNEGFAKKIMEKYGSDYDTVLVCMYWKNVDDPVARAFEAAGAKLVSAGFRGDSSFIRRLKTIIHLADDVVVDDIGTNIGFCMYMKKPVFFEGSELPDGNDKMFAENYRMFRKAFSHTEESISSGQLNEQRRLYNLFWGGEQALLSKEQVSKLFDALEDIYDEAGYRVDHLTEAEKMFLKKCSDIEQRTLIVNALSQDVTYE